MAENASKRLHESSLGHVMVGLFVLVVSVGFGWLLIELRSGPERYALVAEFEILGNISEATKVKLRGYTVGRVDGIQFRPNPKPGEPYFLVEIGVEKGVPVPQGTVAEIRGSGLVGEAFIELVTPDETHTGMLSPGSHLKGQADEGMKTLIARLTDAAGKLGGAGTALRDADFGEKLVSLNRDVSRIADQLTVVSSSADTLLRTSRDMVVGVQPALQQSLENLDKSLRHLSTLMSRADTLMAKSDEDIAQTASALRHVAQHLDQVLARVDTITASRQEQIDSTLDNLHQTSESIRTLSARPLRVFTGTEPRQPTRDAFDVITGNTVVQDSLEGADEP